MVEPGSWLVDLRDDLERAARPLSVAGAGSVLPAELDDLLAGIAPPIPRSAPVVVVCSSGIRAELGAACLEALGFENCAFMKLAPPAD